MKEGIKVIRKITNIEEAEKGDRKYQAFTEKHGKIKRTVVI